MVAVSALLALAAVLWLGILVPINELAGSQATWRSDTRGRLARERGELDARPALTGQARALPKAAVWQRFYGDGEGADGRLRQDVATLVGGSGGTLESLSPLPARREGALVRHGVRLSASMNIEQLRALLAALRAHPRYLRIEHLSITSPTMQPPDTNPSLAVKAEVYGFSPAKVAGGHT
jgi:hypothetical protein